MPSGRFFICVMCLTMPLQLLPTCANKTGPVHTHTHYCKLITLSNLASCTFVQYAASSHTLAERVHSAERVEDNQKALKKGKSSDDWGTEEKQNLRQIYGKQENTKKRNSDFSILFLSHPSSCTSITAIRHYHQNQQHNQKSTLLSRCIKGKKKL